MLGIFSPCSFGVSWIHHVSGVEIDLLGRAQRNSLLHHELPARIAFPINIASLLGDRQWVPLLFCPKRSHRHSIAAIFPLLHFEFRRNFNIFCVLPSSHTRCMNQRTHILVGSQAQVTLLPKVFALIGASRVHHATIEAQIQSICSLCSAFRIAARRYSARTSVRVGLQCSTTPGSLQPVNAVDGCRSR
jgi:hypothetical protein